MRSGLFRVEWSQNDSWSLRKKCVRSWENFSIFHIFCTAVMVAVERGNLTKKFDFIVWLVNRKFMFDDEAERDNSR